MPLVTFLPHEKFCPEGLTVEVPAGTNILELAHDHHIEMESACGGVKACTTCHCIVRKGFDSLEEADELEEDMLDKAWAWKRSRVWVARWWWPIRTSPSRSPSIRSTTLPKRRTEVLDMSLKWIDVLDIAIELAESKPDVDPRYVNFVDLHRWVVALPGFSDDPSRAGEKVLEAIQAAWIDEAD